MLEPTSWQVVWQGREVLVDADVTSGGEVTVRSVVDMTGKSIDTTAFKVEERLDLYEACRQAAGVCPTCGGAGRIRRIQGPKRPAIDLKCPTCRGTAVLRAKTVRLNPETPTKPLPVLGEGPLTPRLDELG